MFHSLNKFLFLQTAQALDSPIPLSIAQQLDGSCFDNHMPFYFNLSEESNVQALEAFRERDVSSCSSFTEMIETVGINGALVLVPVPSWHTLAQVYMGMIWHHGAPTLIQKNNVFLSLSCAARKLGLLYYHSARPNGILHGAIWYLIWNSSEPFNWDMVRQLQPTFDQRLYHGLGHGLHYLTTKRHQLNASQSVDTCEHPHVSQDANANHFIRALRLCMLGPTVLMRYGCSDGLFHSWFEYEPRQPQELINALYPCDSYALSAMCFVWLFAKFDTYESRPGGRLAPYDARVRGLRTQFDGIIIHVCVQMKAPESRVADCIFGLSAIFFVYYHEMAGVGSHTSLMEACMRVPVTFGLGDSRFHCPVLVQDFISVGFDPSLGTGSLMEWCDIVSRRTWRDEFRDQHRISACIVGSLLMLRLVNWNISYICRPFEDLVSRMPDHASTCHSMLQIHEGVPNYDALHLIRDAFS